MCSLWSLFAAVAYGFAYTRRGSCPRLMNFDKAPFRRSDEWNRAVASDATVMSARLRAGALRRASYTVINRSPLSNASTASCVPSGMAPMLPRL